MNIKTRVFLFTLLLPVISGAMAWATIAKLDSLVRDQVRKNNPELDAAIVERVTVASLAEQGAFASDELPALDRHLRFARGIAAGSALVGLLLIGGISYMGYAARSRRDLLLKYFKPGLYVTLILVGVLTAAQAIAAAYSLYYFETVFVERVHMILIIGVAIGGLLAFVAVLRAIVSLFRTADFTVLGQRVAPADQPALWTAVTEVCAQLKASAPDHIVVGLEPTFYVTESEVKCAGEKFKGRTLFVSLAYSRLLTVAEFKAVIGHEMAHFIGEDTKFSQHFFPVYRGTFTALNNLAGNAVHASLAIAQMPAVAFLGYFLESFMISEKALSRQRETEADAMGASVGGPTHLATALVKVHAYGTAWQNILTDVHYNNEALRTEQNLVRPFVTQAQSATAETMAKAGEIHLAHPTDSHPTLTVRLESLKIELQSAVAAVNLPAMADSAASLIAGNEEIEIRQSSELRKLLRPA